MKLMDWEQAQAILENVDKDFCAALGALYEVAPREIQPSLLFCLVKYPFSHKIIQNGAPFSSSGSALDGNFIFPSGLPLGIITKNYCEVVEFRPISGESNKALSYQTKAILSSSDFIGVFELMDCVTGVNIQSLPDWTILSGCNNFFFSGDIPLTRLNQIAAHNGVALSHDEFSSSDFIGEGVCRILNPNFRKGCDAEILYLSNAWYNMIFGSIDNIADDTVASADSIENGQYKTKCSMLSKAWGAASISRDIHSNIQRYFDSRDMEANDNGYKLMTSVLDIVYGRRAVYRNAVSGTTMLPVESIIEFILRPAGLAEFVMIPKYYKPNRDSYVPLAMLIPNIFAGRSASTIEERIRQAISTVLRARNNCHDNGNIGKIFDKFIDIIKATEFYIPRKGKVYGSPSFKYSITKTTVERQDTDEKKFLNGEKLLSNSPFFKACMKLPSSVT